jgi:hypothetical protein
MATLTRRQAQTLTATIHEGLANAENALREFIDGKGWAAMGFGTFAEWWSTHLSDITLATELRPHVIYQMFAEGQTVDDIAGSIKGTGPEAVTRIKRQRDNGVPADQADVQVRPYNRRRPSLAGVLHIDVGAAKMREYRKIAKDYGMSVENIAADAISRQFDTMLAIESTRRAD